MLLVILFLRGKNYTLGLKNKIKQFVLSNVILQNISFALFRIYLKMTTEHVIGYKAKIGPSCFLEGKNSFGESTTFIGSYIGFASYIAKNSSLQDVKIGKYCSIGPNVNTIHGNHPTNTFVSTHPSFFSTDMPTGFSYTTNQLFKEKPNKLNDKEPYTTKIGNDVWIGASVNIIEGVKIGDGCIIASGALINKDIAPYSIVGGVPAKLIRKRFKDEEIEFLRNFKWWQRPEKWIEQNASMFTDIKKFIKLNQ